MGSAEGEETMQGLGGREEERILVSVRVRPLNEKEISRNEVVDWECINDTTIVYRNHLSPERSMYPTSYTFGCLDVIAQQGRCMRKEPKPLFFQLSTASTHKEREFQLKFSAMEIYNESTIASSTRESLGKNSGTLAATLNFVDLAGSERASQALSAGSRLKEGSHINRSLLTLGTVIRKLSKGRTGHIPFRDSKLTRILQSSLGGNARTAIVCTMSPARSYVEQSRNTLLFATCAKEITTNACVNVVVSEKALVKQLQRELARLQSELRSSSPLLQDDASDVLRERDSKIEELQRQVRQLTLQLDLALAQIHDLQQGLGDRSPTIWEGDDSFSPKLYVRQILESSLSDATTVTDHQPFNCGALAFETPRSPDRHSRVSYDEDYSISDFEDHTLPSSPHKQMFTETPGDASPPMCIQTPIVVGNNRGQVPEGITENTINHSEIDSCLVSEEIGEQSRDSYEIVPHQISKEISGQTPETFNMHQHHQQVSNGHGSRYPYFAEVDPYQVLDGIGDQTPNSYENDCYQVSPEIAEKNLNDDHIDPDHIPEATTEQIEEHLEDYCKEVQCIGSEMSESLPIQSLLTIGESSPLMGHENDMRKGDEPKQETTLSDMNPSSIQHAEEPSGKQEIIDLPECKNLYHLESRSCQSNDRSCRSSISLEEVKFEMKPESGDGGDGFITLEETQKLSAQGHDVENEVSKTSTGDVELDEASVTNVKILNHINYAENSTCDTKRKDIAEPQCTERLANFQLEDIVHKGNQFSENKKDVGLNPQDDLDTRFLDSKKLQTEILDLWDICNVSLVHRTYFLLLFINIEPADTIYMEVERRRLSFIKDAFSQGKAIVLDGRKLTPHSSKRSLHHERKKLGRLMKRRLTSQERIDLYIKWGIDLDTKRRSSQLAHRLWIDQADTDHILDSANIVAKLVQLCEPQVPKEVFGLNLMTKEARRKSFRW
ncbi:hypothetical protein Cgig2_007432 [Carnegiea gigantea]|uniref:Kinesin-like protein n=1 Tax=Carnegiea gigantea TaxID=171969 RepID=A0A9Q1QRY7_9CARY|nr:hypothetical protein Cgig2_007432 [Carnegiea gigantea]